MTDPTQILRAALVALLQDMLRGAEERYEEAHQRCLASRGAWGTLGYHEPFDSRDVARDDAAALFRVIALVGDKEGI